MPLIIPQTSSQGTVSYPFALTVDGNDWIKVPGTAPTAGIPIESIELEEAGPGAVSNLVFTIEDPGTSALMPTAGAEVRFYRTTDGYPLFRGTVNSYKVIPKGVGRDIIVECDGIEKRLDMIVPTYTTSSTPGSVLLEKMVNEMAGLFLRADNIAIGTTDNGTRATPIGRVDQPLIQYGITVTGTTFREAVRQVATACYTQASGWGTPALAFSPPNVTMDFYGGLRMWSLNEQPDDYGWLVISNTPAPPTEPKASARINYEVHPGDVVHEVYVNGATAGVSGWYSDGTGVIGQQAYINDGSLTTVAKVQSAAQAYLAAQAATIRGTFRLDAFQASDDAIHAGSLLDLTDPSLGLTAQTFIIQTIRKTFAAGTAVLQRWDVSFGGRRPSAMQEIRNLNRDVLS